MIEPILEAIPAARQEDARHYGVHPYFTRRPANVVRDYIKRFSEEGDTVLDPFGGTGVTAIEAFLLGRNAIQNDLNPFANFIARNIADTTLPSTAPLRQAYERVEQGCGKAIQEIEKDPAAAKRWLQQLPLPENIRLPRNSDAEYYYEMFTPRQLAGLALIKRAIEREGGVIRDLLRLAWSASVAKLNRKAGAVRAYSAFTATNWRRDRSNCRFGTPFTAAFSMCLPPRRRSCVCATTGRSSPPG